MDPHIVITPGCWGIIASAIFALSAILYSELVEQSKNSEDSFFRRRKRLILGMLVSGVLVATVFSCYWCSNDELSKNSKQLENAMFKVLSQLRERYLDEIGEPGLKTDQIALIQGRLADDLRTQVVIAGAFARLYDPPEERFEEVQKVFESAVLSVRDGILTSDVGEGGREAQRLRLEWTEMFDRIQRTMNETLQKSH